MKTLTAGFQTKRNLPNVSGVWKKIELLPLSEELVLGDWTDQGRLGDQTALFALAEFEDKVYGGVGANGHVYRRDEIDNWIDCGQPTGGPAVIYCLFVFNNELYCGTDGVSKVFKYLGGTAWADCGSPAGVGNTVQDLIEFEGDMYACTKNGHVYRYDGGMVWTDRGQVGPLNTWLYCMEIFEATLYAGGRTAIGEGHVYRYDGGTTWFDCGRPGPAVVNVYTLKSYGSLYVGTNPNAHVFIYLGGTSWTDLGQVGAEGSVSAFIVYRDRLYAGTVRINTGKVFRYEGGVNWTDLVTIGWAVYCFTECAGILYAGTSPEARVFSAEATTSVNAIDITPYVIDIGIKEHRLEDLLNEPIVSLLSLTVKDKPFQEYPFFTSGGTVGIFDKITSAAVTGYQLRITTGITGEADIILVFDGKLDTDTIDRIGLERIEFTAYGWLKDADGYNAEEIADPDNPPFRNISGISFVSATGYTGAKEMKFGIEGTAPYLQYENGEKVTIYSAVNPGSPLTLWDGPEENSITINYGTLPTESKSDKFTIINYLGSLWACRWYENIKLETIISKLFDHLGIPTQDINVRDFETGTEKHFVYLAPFFTDAVTSDMEVSAVKVVNYDAPTKKITMLVGIQEQLDGDGSLWRIEIDLINWEYKKTEMSSFHVGKVLKFLYFNGRNWAVRGIRIDYNPLAAGLGNRWCATQLLRLTTDFTSIDRTVVVPNNLPSPDVATDMNWDILLGNTCSCNDTTQDMYALRQYRIAGVFSVDLVRYNDAGLGGWIVIRVGMEEGSGQTQILADDYGTFAEQQANDYFYYGCRWFFPSDRQYVVKYDITGNAFVFSHQCNQDGVDTKCMNFVWEKKAGNECYVFMKYLEKNDLFVYEYANWWFRDDGTFFITYDKQWQPVYNKKYLYSNQAIREKYYTQWYINDSGQWFIQSINAENGIDIYTETIDFLHYGYEGITSAPQIFKQGVPDWDHHFAGCLVDTDSFAIVPYVYTDEALSTVHIANFMGYTCRDALKFLAEAYLCVMEFYERYKARFYYRETNLGSTTLDCDIYKKEPRTELWVNRYDGIIIENSDEDLRWRFGNTGHNARILRIDNRFISEGTGEIVGSWMYDFFNTIKRFVTLEVPFRVEMELMDKVGLTLRDMGGGVFWNFNTLVYEISFDISSMKDTSMLVKLKLLEIGGTILHSQILERRVITV